MSGTRKETNDNSYRYSYDIANTDQATADDLKVQFVFFQDSDVENKAQALKEQMMATTQESAGKYGNKTRDISFIKRHSAISSSDDIFQADVILPKSNQFRTITESFKTIRKSNIIVINCDPAISNSVENVKRWLAEWARYGSNDAVPIAIVELSSDAALSDGQKMQAAQLETTIRTTYSTNQNIIDNITFHRVDPNNIDEAQAFLMNMIDRSHDLNERDLLENRFRSRQDASLTAQRRYRIDLLKNEIIRSQDTNQICINRIQTLLNDPLFQLQATTSAKIEGLFSASAKGQLIQIQKENKHLQVMRQELETMIKTLRGVSKASTNTNTPTEHF